MASFIAKKLCPQLVLIRGSYHKYGEESARIRRVLEDYGAGASSGLEDEEESTGVLMMSLDEGYVDITVHLLLRQSFSQERRRFPKVCFWLTSRSPTACFNVLLLVNVMYCNPPARLEVFTGGLC